MHLMGNLSGSNLKTAAAWNRGLALRLLRKYETLSRRQIAQMTGLKGATLTYIVREMLDRDLVRTVGTVNVKRAGQKEILLTINPDLGWTLGASLGPHGAQLVLADAAGGRIAAHRVDVGRDLYEAPERLRAGLDAWLGGLGRPAGRMLAVGVGVQGVVDSSAGIVLRSSWFDATNVPLRMLLAEQFGDAHGAGVAVAVDHDANFAASAEAMDGAARDVSHFVHFLMNCQQEPGGRVLFNGFGTSLFLDGKVYRGAHFGAGELATTLAPPHLPATDADLAALRDPAGELTEPLARLAENVGHALAAIVNLTDLPMAILGGTVGAQSRAFLDATRAAADRLLVAIPGRTLAVVPSHIGAEAVARGATIVATDLALVSGNGSLAYVGQG